MKVKARLCLTSVAGVRGCITGVMPARSSCMFQMRPTRRARVYVCVPHTVAFRQTSTNDYSCMLWLSSRTSPSFELGSLAVASSDARRTRLMNEVIAASERRLRIRLKSRSGVSLELRRREHRTPLGAFSPCSW